MLFLILELLVAFLADLMRVLIAIEKLTTRWGFYASNDLQ